MIFNSRKFFKAGFTLVELILVISILAILATITIVSINPPKQLAKSRDAKRTADVYLILGALHNYAADHDGDWPVEITTEEKEICVTDGVDCTELYDLSILTNNQEYLDSIPKDPLCLTTDYGCGDSNTGYFLKITNSGKISVSAPMTESDNLISVVR